MISQDILCRCCKPELELVKVGYRGTMRDATEQVFDIYQCKTCFRYSFTPPCSYKEFMALGRDEDVDMFLDAALCCIAYKKRLNEDVPLRHKIGAVILVATIIGLTIYKLIWGYK